MREIDLKNRTMKLLARLNVPRAMTGNAEAAKIEAEFLCDEINKLAPSKQYIDWFDYFQETLLRNLETRSWPTAKQISQAAKEIAPKRPEFIDYTQSKGYEPDELKINAERIKRNEDVGESYIIGTFAEQMVRSGLVTQEQLEPYKKYLNHWKKN